MLPRPFRLPRWCFAGAALFAPAVALAALAPTVQERLGYPADAKLLIIHADDLGLSHGTNAASFRAMEQGVVTSASVMMTTPWVLEVVRYAETHPEADLGVHLTLTAEWKYFKWGPLLGRDGAPSLVTSQGYFHDNVPDFAAAAKLDEVEREIRAQVDRALALGIDVTHLDAHMGVMSATPDLLRLYLKIGDDYRLPVRLHRHAAERAGGDLDDVRAALANYPSALDAIHGAPPSTYPDGMAAYYHQVLRELKPGLNLLVLHLAFDDTEARAITVEHPLWGAAWRQIDTDWALDAETKRIIAEQGIILINHRELRDKLHRGGDR